ncbi:MAG: hypothetical protein V1719_01395 [Patescibacteria group bacterium]
MKIQFVYPVCHRERADTLRAFLLRANPFVYISTRVGLVGLKHVLIVHRPLKYAAEFQPPNSIYIDFRQPADYSALSVAHEYVHLLLRHHRWGSRLGMPRIIQRYARSKDKYHYTKEGAVEQVLAILLQLSYEDQFKLRKFNSTRAQELMKIMGVWPMGQPFLRRWPSFLKSRGGLLLWLRKSFSGS